MKKNIGISFIIILIIISILFSYIYIPYINNNSDYVIVSKNTIWRNNNNNWKSISKRNIPKYSFKEIYSFDGNEYIGKTYNDYSDDLNVYNKNFEKLNLNNELLSIISNDKINPIDNVSKITEADDLDLTNINNVLNKYSIKSDYEMTKYLVDINNDGNLDELYNITNFYMNENDSTVFSIAFSVINNNIEIIDYVIVSKEEELKEKTININHIVDIDNDKQYEVIISKSSFGDVKNDCNTLYKYDSSKNKFVKIIGC